MQALSIGKLRGLQQCATRRGAVAVLALDHRNNLRRALNPQAPQCVTDAELTAFKVQTVNALAPAATAVLLDVEYGAGQCIASGALPGDIGWLAAMEASGYTGDLTARHGHILPGWSVEKAKRMGANAVKLLVYYHPDADTASEIEMFVRQVAANCKAQDMLLFLEPLSYSPKPADKELPPHELPRVVLETARRLVVPGVDIVKAEFPLNITAESDERQWAEACAELSAACSVPWVLLSASVEYETFLRQVAVACRAGASGIAVGRAVWKEAVSLKGEERERFLRTTGFQRMARLTSLCDALASPWTDFYTPPQLESSWYTHY